MCSLESQLLSNYIDVTYSLTGRVAVSAISPLFEDRFGRSLRFCHLEFLVFFVALSNVFYRGGGGFFETLESWASVVFHDNVNLEYNLHGRSVSKFCVCQYIIVWFRFLNVIISFFFIINIPVQYTESCKWFLNEVKIRKHHYLFIFLYIYLCI